MYSAIFPELRRTLALRLTAWYAAIFAVSSALAFIVVYVLMVASVAARTDEDMRQDIEEFAALYRQDGLDRVRREMVLDTQGEEARRVFFRIWSRDGVPLATTELVGWSDLTPVPKTLLRRLDAGADPVLETLALASRSDRVRTVAGALSPGMVLEIGQSLDEDEEFVGEILHGFMLGLALVLLLGGPVGWFMAHRALRGVKRVTRTANEIAEGALERRVPIGTQGDEIDDLARTFNAMLDRIQALIIGMRDMTDNLAHDIRSPLTHMRAAAEMGLANGNVDGEAVAANTIEECDRLLEMIRTSLDIAEADAGAAMLNLCRVDVVEILGGAVELFQALAEDNRIGISVNAPTSCWIQADRQRLQRVVANLLDNALKYTRAGGQVRITLREQDESVCLSIEDTGIGISAADLPRIFQRFYRCERSRSPHGIGLGLNLALAFVRTHGGDITATSTENKGSTFTVVLPRTPRAPSLANQTRQSEPIGSRVEAIPGA